MTFQERLRRARKRKKMTLEQVAEQIGVAKSTYANYELNYREPSVATIQLLSVVLETSTDYLLGVSNRETANPLETNAKILLQTEQLHWDGIKLEEEDLKSIRDFLEHLAGCRRNQQSSTS
ncbi:helix-turn-helix domain-containing protein [Paenibacillus koleovorans]|uniref:helix-turn-helix domain-containing protein n=1 Tax=Paenibacillus koleovorans TaxID=121608 RepID=UPI0024822621|nr:helix-turn-helix transcriptional regulator [Paenibacillus koleovorans]